MSLELKRAQFYSDLFKLKEDDGIALIGHYLTEHADTVSIVTDDIPGKLERYIQKLTAQFPMVEVFEQGTGPVPNTVYFKARKKGA